MTISWTAIYVLWRGEITRYVRAKSRIIGSLAMPVFFLAFLGLGALAFGLLFMLLIAFTFIGLGLVFASRMKDMQGFGIVMNFVIFPFFFLSGALTPLGNFPWFIRALSYADPPTYGIDGLRAVMIGKSTLPAVFDLAVMVAFALIMLFLGANIFEKSEGV